MRQFLYFVSIPVAIAVMWMASRRSGENPSGEIEGGLQGRQSERASMQHSLMLTAEIRNPSEMPQTAEDVWREYEETYPLKVSGARGGRNQVVYSLDAAPRRYAPEVQHLGDPPSNPHEHLIVEVHQYRSEISGSIHEDSLRRWGDLVDTVSDSEASLMMVLTNVPPLSLLNPFEASVLKSLEPSNANSPYHSQNVARYLRDRRSKALQELEGGNPADPHWLSDHVE
jgi:hypothetical protein